MSPHSNTLASFRANQYFLLLLIINAACLAQKQQIPILQSLVRPDLGSKPTTYHTGGKHVNHHTDVVLQLEVYCFAW